MPFTSIPGFPSTGGSVGVNSGGSGFLTFNPNGENVTIQGFIGVKDQIEAITRLGTITEQGKLRARPVTRQCGTPEVGKAIAQNLRVRGCCIPGEKVLDGGLTNNQGLVGCKHNGGLGGRASCGDFGSRCDGISIWQIAD